jgi:peptidase YpeB-like protein
MRTRIATIAFLSACIAAPLGAMAQTVGVGPAEISVGEARDIAAMNGVVAIRKIELYDGTWHVDGRDEAGRHVEMSIDPRSGTIAHLERYD